MDGNSFSKFYTEFLLSFILERIFKIVSRIIQFETNKESVIKRLVSISFPSFFLSFSLFLCSRNVTPLYAKWVTRRGEGRRGVCVCVCGNASSGFFFITQIVNGVGEGHDKRSPVGQIAVFSLSRWKRVDDSRDRNRDRGATRSQFFELASP